MNLQDQELISRLSEYKRVIQSEQRIENKRQADKLRMQYEEWKISPFEIELLFMTPNYKGELFDIFEIEGLDNANMIFEEYRKIGHSLKLRKLVLHCKGKKIKAINFKYKNYNS